ncbi:MAG: gliding motility-associated C-terminal domain-containing protein [Saprospiraceae bacterium]|nr:gliding motility-associated C-terminal domain-containing protein [Saprospiraceae bacterium]
MISHTQTVTVEPIPEASFINPPASVTINCDQLQTFTPEVLMYSNGGSGNCEIAGSVDPVGDGTLDICGNEVTYTWEFTDQCARLISHTQTVTVEPIPEAMFIDPPVDMTINCDELQAFTPTVLSFTNNGTGDCLIEGTVDPVGDGTLDKCGSTVTFTWEFTDQCARTISHTQSITTEPIAEANYIDPPGDITINCDDLQTFVPASLDFTNGGMGDCLISGTVDPVGDGTLDICGNSVTYSWEFTDECGRLISHNQTVTVEPIAPPTFIDPPVDATVSCADKPNEGEGLNLSYTNGGTGACETAGEIAPIEEYNVTECGGTIVNTWMFTDDCDNEISHTQTITVEPASQAQLEDLPPSSITIECNENTGTGPDLVVTNNADGDCLIEETISPQIVGDADICGGSFQFLWEFTDECGRVTSFTQTVNVNPAPEAMFDNLPVDIDIDCSDNGNDPEELSYSNGESGACDISGNIAGTRTGLVDYCGGTLTDSWEFTDECGRTITAERNVNVAPAPPAEYVNPPADIVVDCDNVNGVPAVLSYTNGETGVCQISGTSIAVVSGGFNECGGELVYTWSFVDDCGRPITHSQSITVNPAPDPAFIDPPQDVTIGCDDTYLGPDILNYTNGEGFPCGISGMVAPSSVQVDNIITNTWEVTLACSGELLSHTQVVTLSIVPDISINPSSAFICLGDSYDLSDIIVNENNGTNITVSYHNNFPPNAGNEISSVVNPTTDFNYVINAVNEFGCEDFEIFNVFVENPPFAGEDQSTTVCSDGIPINLFNFLPPFVDMGGSWLDVDGIGANISNPFGATFNNVLPGNYNLYYVVFSTTVCENDTMVLNLNVIDNVSFEITEVTCIGSNDFYEVYLNSNGFDIQTTEGDLINLSGDEYVVTNIPITTGVFISAFEALSGCSITEFVDIPDCDCPDIDPPVVENVSICVNEQPVQLSVTVPSGMTANWYLEQNSSTALVSGSTDYTVQDSAVGQYSFFVETYDPATDCTSNVKTKIDLEINGLPEVEDTSLIICDLENDGQEIVSLQSFNLLVSNNPANTFSYFETLVDAQNGTNQMADSQVLTLGSTMVFVRVINSADCESIGTLDIILNDLPQVDIESTSPACIGESNGSIDITAIDVDGEMMTSLDGITYELTTSYSDLSSGTYMVYIQDENECLSVYDVVIPDGLDIILTEFSSECNDNGTNTDPSDDFYTISLFIENNQGNSGTYNVIIGGTVEYTFDYGSNESFEIPIDEGNTIDITIEDVSFSCTKVQTFGPLNPCSTNCEVSVDVLDFDCNDNGTATDPSDDFYTVTVNASAMNGAINNTYNVFLDGVLLYNFMYGETETFDVNANGNNLNITFQDNEDIQCQTSQEIGPLSPCSEGCQIMLDVISIECSNNGTSTNQNDDFYTFTINGNIINGVDLTQFELFVDGVSQGFYNYGEDIDIDVPADEAVHLIDISDQDNVGCSDDFTTDVLTNCSTDCEIILNSLTEICFDNNTADNSLDDFYEITINASSVNGASNQLFNLYIDGTFIGAFPYDQDNVVTIDADNMVHTLVLQDSEELACELNIETIELISCSDDCLNNILITNVECFDNNTATNINDDFYEFELVGELLNGDSNTSFELYVDGVLEGSYTYGESISVTIPADGNIHTFLIIDEADSSCTSEIQSNELTSCSTDCEIISETLVYTCFDNGTPTDPSDDFIEMVITASAVNGATNNMYNLYFNGVLEGIYSYGISETFTVPAQNQTINLRFQDSQDLQCELTFDTDILSPCSDACLIDQNIVNIECFNNGTPTDVNDDYYEITLVGVILNGSPASTFEIFVDNVLQGSNGYGTEVVVTIPADGSSHVILISDADDPSCSAEFTTEVLTSCSTDCEITMSDLEVVCFDNGTLDDPSDDFYEVNFTTNAINGAAGFELTISGSSEGVYNYGEQVSLNFPADGANLILVLTDLDDVQCKLNQAIGPLDPCSNLCTIEPLIMESMCFDNGTPIDPSDDYWEIVIIVNPANGETAPTFDLRVDGVLDGTYLYSENITITISADNVSHLIDVNDSNDINCSASVTTQILNFCSTPCEITATYDNVSCDNNGTNDTSNDDLFYVDLLVSNPEAGEFEIPSLSIVASYNEVLNIGPFDISNGNAAIEIFDTDQNLCSIVIELIPPAPCSDCVQQADAGTGGTISCEVTEIMLEGFSSEAGEYFWYGPGGNLISEELTAIAPSIGLYTFSVVFEDGCIVEDQVEVIADVDLPVALWTSNGAITCEKLSTVLDGSLSGTTNDYFFYWYDENGNLLSQDQTYETDMPGVYFLQVEFQDNNCKSALEPVVVEAQINEPSAIIYAEPSNVIDCVIESIVLSTDEQDNVNYIWSLNGENIDNAAEIEISDIGTYGLLAIDTITGCSNEADLIISSLVDYPNISLSVPQSLDCDNEQIEIIASSIQSGDNLISFWTDENQNVILENQNTLEVTEPGEYYYTLIDTNNGCENTDSVLITVFEDILDISITPEITYFEGEGVLLTASINISDSEIDSISWAPNENMSCPTCLSTRIDNPTDSIYTITVVDIYGCIDTAQVRLISQKRPEIYIPNILNPGSNSGNNTFSIFGNSAVERIVKVQVFDRWGNLVYLSENIEINNPGSGWDGRFNGKEVEQGVYVYRIEALLEAGQIETYFGDLTIIR